MKTSAQNQKGFTLIEILVVVVILAILGTIGVSVYSGAQKNARDSKSQAEIISIAKSIETARTTADSGAVRYNYTSANFTTDFKVIPSGINYVYCLRSGDGVPNDLSVPVVDSTWTQTACPTNWKVLGTAPAADGSNPGADIVNKKAWKVCARLENNTSAYCKESLSQ